MIELGLRSLQLVDLSFKRCAVCFVLVLDSVLTHALQNNKVQKYKVSKQDFKKQGPPNFPHQQTAARKVFYTVRRGQATLRDFPFR